jgi:hypothetical protein
MRKAEDLRQNSDFHTLSNQILTFGSSTAANEESDGFGNTTVV